MRKDTDSTTKYLCNTVGFVLSQVAEKVLRISAPQMLTPILQASVTYLVALLDVVASYM
jgi:hypothetical protein